MAKHCSISRSGHSIVYLASVSKAKLFLLSNAFIHLLLVQYLSLIFSGLQTRYKYTCIPDIMSPTPTENHGLLAAQEAAVAPIKEIDCRFGRNKNKANHF